MIKPVLGVVKSPVHSICIRLCILAKRLTALGCYTKTYFSRMQQRSRGVTLLDLYFGIERPNFGTLDTNFWAALCFVCDVYMQDLPFVVDLIGNLHGRIEC